MKSLNEDFGGLPPGVRPVEGTETVPAREQVVRGAGIQDYRRNGSPLGVGQIDQVGPAKGKASLGVNDGDPLSVTLPH